MVERRDPIKLDSQSQTERVQNNNKQTNTDKHRQTQKSGLNKRRRVTRIQEYVFSTVVVVVVVTVEMTRKKTSLVSADGLRTISRLLLNDQM